jgi:type IV pilus assembly protein PilM
MNVLEPILKRFSRLEPEALLHLRPTYPPVAVEVDRGDLTLVRVRAKDRARPYVEAFHSVAAPEAVNGGSILRPSVGSPAELAKRIRDLLVQTGTRPGKISLILPDNLAKVSIVTLPERPRTRKQLAELLRFKLRRSVPFKLEDAVLTSTVVSGDGPETHVLVAVMLRSVVEQYEAAFTAAGTRPGLVDLCTPSLFNLVRRDVLAASSTGSDAALLNCTRGYFTLIIVRSGQVIFFRCKSFAGGEEAEPADNLTVMGRELASSLSYYQEKLAGTGIGTLFVRHALAGGGDELAPVLDRLGIAAVRAIDPTGILDPAVARRLQPEDFLRAAPALGAAAGRVAA